MFRYVVMYTNQHTHVNIKTCDNIYSVNYPGKKTMKSLRLKKNEEELLRKKSIEINKVLINSNRQPVTESELLHEVVEQGLKRIEAGKEKRISLL